MVCTLLLQAECEGPTFISCTAFYSAPLLVHPEWLAGSPKQDADGRPYGGSAQDNAESTARWNQERASKIRLLEVRGILPDEVTCPDTVTTFSSDVGTVPKRSNYACGACGTVQDVMNTIKATQKSGQMAGYAIQGYAPKRDDAGIPYGGRFFRHSKKSSQGNMMLLRLNGSQERMTTWLIFGQNPRFRMVL